MINRAMGKTDTTVTLERRILQWLANGNVSQSAKAMAYAIADINEGYYLHPYDPDDLNRCYQFLSQVPEARAQLHKVAKLSPIWNNLIEHWDEIETLFASEVGTELTPGQWAPKTFKLMKKLGC